MAFIRENGEHGGARPGGRHRGRLRRLPARGRGGPSINYNRPPDGTRVCPSSSPSATRRPRSPSCVGELTATLTAWGRSFEIIVVDDGSTDESFEILARLQAADARLRVIRFRRNFGQTAAFAAGFAHARGRLIATSDGDLQNDPRDIPSMVDVDRKGLRHRLRLAEGPEGHAVAAGAVGPRQPADLGRHRRAAARLRVLAEGVPRRGDQAAEAVRRDAPVSAGHRERAGRRDQGSRGQPPGAEIRRVEVRHLADDARRPRSADREVPPELLDAAAADLRPHRPGHGLRRRR